MSDGRCLQSKILALESSVVRLQVFDVFDRFAQNTGLVQLKTQPQSVSLITEHTKIQNRPKVVTPDSVCNLQYWYRRNGDRETRYGLC